MHALKSGQKYDAKLADVYSLGISLYEMLFKVVPYCGRYKLQDPILISRQKAQDYTFPPSSVVTISGECRALIRLMLEPNPRRRPTVNRVLTNVWFAGVKIEGAPDVNAVDVDPTSSSIQFRKQSIKNAQTKQNSASGSGEQGESSVFDEKSSTTTTTSKMSSKSKENSKNKSKQKIEKAKRKTRSLVSSVVESAEDPSSS